MICKDSGMIQLKSLLPLELVYSEFHSEAIGSIWELHIEAFCQFIKKYSLGDILEIGGSNGALAKKFQSYNNDDSFWTIIEPNPSYTGCENIKVIQGFFDENINISRISTIVHSHVLEHLYDPNILLNHINHILPENGKHIFSIPNLLLYLKNKFSNAINFEHTYLLTEHFTDYLLQKFGFEIIEKFYFEDHSIFYSTQKKTGLKKPIITNYYNENKELYLKMIEYYDTEVERFNQLISNYKGQIYLFGGHIFSQFLLQRGLKQDCISSVIDNSLIKQGKRLYGTNLIVQSPQVLANRKDIAIIVKAGQYQNEIIKQLLQINSTILIWQ